MHRIESSELLLIELIYPKVYEEASPIVAKTQVILSSSLIEPVVISCSTLPYPRLYTLLILRRKSLFGVCE